MNEESPMNAIKLQEPAIKWQEPAIKWQEPAIKWQEPAIKWQEPAIKWQEPAIKWQEPAIKWQEPTFKKRNEKKDTLFGIHFKGTGLYIGKSPVLINDKNMKITIDGINYNLTPGLLELITKFNPDKEVYDKDDL